MYTVSQGACARVVGLEGAGAGARLIFAVTHVGQEGGALEVRRLFVVFVGSSLASVKSRILLKEGCPSCRWVSRISALVGSASVLWSAYTLLLLELCARMLSTQSPVVLHLEKGTNSFGFDWISRPGVLPKIMV